MVPGRPLMVAQPLTGATVGPSPSKYLTMRGTSWSCSALGLCLSGAHLCDLMAVSSLSSMRSVEPHALQFGQLAEPEGQFGPGHLAPSVMPAGQSLGICP